MSDIHGNSPALRAVLDDIWNAGCRRVVVIGDIINGVDPVGCVDLLAGHPAAVCLSGNAEWYLATPDLHAFPLAQFRWLAEVIALVEWWRARLDAAQREWLAGLPHMLLEQGSCFVHDSPLDRLDPVRRVRDGLAPQYHEFVFHSRGLAPHTAASEFAQVFEWMQSNRVADLFCGHTHEPFLNTLAGRRICNSGSVGMPLDGDPRACWVLAEPAATGRPSLTIRRVAYPVAETLELVDRAAADGFPRFDQPERLEAYKQGLRYGSHWRMHLPR